MDASVRSNHARYGSCERAPLVVRAAFARLFDQQDSGSDLGTADETLSRYASIVVRRSAGMLFRTFPVQADKLSIVGVLDGQVTFAGAFDGLADTHG